MRRRETALNIHITPYEWAGPYAEMRSADGWRHDAGLCADIRADWMPAGERIILRSSEIVGYGGAFLYDDHLPPCERNGRGKHYEHIPFQWNAGAAPQRLTAACEAPGKGAFSLDLTAADDGIDVELTVRSDLEEPMGNVDWHFCVVAYDAPSIGDPEVERTFLFDGERLRSLAELQGGTTVHMHRVAGAGGFVPESHQSFPSGPVEAQASVVLVANRAGTHTVAVGFERSYAIFSNPTNMCFHADPYFGPLTRKGETRRVRGKLTLAAGTAQEVFERLQSNSQQ